MPRETLVLLPGMMCDQRLFGPQINAFGSSFHIVVPKLDQSSIDEMARHVLRSVPDGPINLAGLSMGGIVAMRLAAMAPDRISRLAILGSNHMADTQERRRLRERQINDVRNGRLRHVITEEMKPVYLAKANRDNKVLLDLLIEMAMDCGEVTFIAQSRALRGRSDMSSAIAGFNGPPLVLCGIEDQLCPPERHRQMSDLNRQAKLVMVENAGHISTLENPAAVNNALKRWLSTSPAKSVLESVT